MTRSIAVYSQNKDLEKSVRELCRGLPQQLKPEVFNALEPCLGAFSRKSPPPPAAVIVDEKSLDGISQGSQIDDKLQSSAPQSVLFYQKLRILDGHSQTPIIAVVQEITAKHLALSSDYTFFRIVAMSESPGGATMRSALQALTADLARPPAIRQAFQRMSLALQEGRQGDADAAIEECYQVYRDDPEVLLEFGNHCIRRGQLEKADRVFSKLSGRGQSSLRVCNFLARMQLLRGNAGAALSILEKADLISPGNLDRLVLMGDSFRIQGEFKVAEEKYRQAMVIDNSCQSAVKGLGLVALSQGEADRALELFSSTCTEEEIAGFFNNTAVLAVKRAHFGQANGLYAAAAQKLKNPETKARVLFNMGLMFRRWNKPSEAFARFREALALDPSLEKADRHLAIVAGVMPAAQLSEQDLTDIMAVQKSESLKESTATTSLPSDSQAAARKPPATGGAVAGMNLGGRILSIEERPRDLKAFSVAALISKAPRQRGLNGGAIKELANLGENKAEVVSRPTDIPATQSLIASGRPSKTSTPAKKHTKFIDDEGDGENVGDGGDGSVENPSASSPGSKGKKVV